MLEEIERLKTMMSAPEKLTTARYYLENLFIMGRFTRVDLSHHMKIIVDNNLLPKLKYVRMIGEDDTLVDNKIMYFFDNNLTQEEFVVCYQLYTPCNAWSIDKEKVKAGLQRAYDKYIKHADKGGFFVFCEEGARWQKSIEQGNYKVYDYKYVRDVLDSLGAYDGE